MSSIACHMCTCWLFCRSICLILSFCTSCTILVISVLTAQQIGWFLLCFQPAEKRMVSSVTMEVELAGDKNTWTPLLDARTGHSLVSDNSTFFLHFTPWMYQSASKHNKLISVSCNLLLLTAWDKKLRHDIVVSKMPSPLRPHPARFAVKCWEKLKFYY